MATYAIGDVQGCYDQLCHLLETIKFNKTVDRLWFAGDLINRGPKSLEVLRFVKSLGSSAIVVLGNHDLHLLAAASGTARVRHKDTFADILETNDCQELCAWLQSQPLVHHDSTNGFTMMHAGLVPQWDLETALKYSREVEAVLQSDKASKFFQHMYGNWPKRWHSYLFGWSRLRFICNCLTRIRFCTAKGSMDLTLKHGLGTQPKQYMPWFKVPNRASRDMKILFGHWAALQGKVDEPNVYALDTGCVWGGQLSALRLDDMQWFRVPGLDRKQ